MPNICKRCFIYHWDDFIILCPKFQFPLFNGAIFWCWILGENFFWKFDSYSRDVLKRFHSRQIFRLAKFFGILCEIPVSYSNMAKIKVPPFLWSHFWCWCLEVNFFWRFDWYSSDVLKRFHSRQIFRLAKFFGILFEIRVSYSNMAKIKIPPFLWSHFWCWCLEVNFFLKVWLIF